MQALESMPPSVFSVTTSSEPAAEQLHSPILKYNEEQLVPLDLIKASHMHVSAGKENQAQDLSMKKHRQPLTHVNNSADKWRPW